MPFYEYQCKNCGHDLEAMQKITEPPLKKCCELELAERIVEVLPKRPDGLKLSRDGLTGILPVIMLAWRNDSAPMRS